MKFESGPDANAKLNAGDIGIAYLGQLIPLWLSCLMEHSLLLPVWLLFAAFLLPQGLPPVWLGVLPLLTLAGVLLGACLRKLWQRWSAAACLGAAFVLAAAAVAGGEAPGLFGFGNASAASSAQATALAILQTAALFAAGVFCALQGMTVTARQGNFRLYWAGIGLYFVAGIVFPRIDALKGTVPLMTWAGLVCLGAALFVTNHQFLRYSSLSGDSTERLPAGLRRHNRLFIGAIVIVSLLLAAGAGRWIGGLLWRLIKAVVRWLAHPQEPEPLPEQAAPGMPSMEPPLPMETRDSGLLTRILDIAFYAFGTLIIAALLGFILYWLYRNAGGILRKAIDRLLALLRRESAAPENIAYRDEETSIFTWEAALQSWKQAGARLFRSGQPSERWEDMGDNRERVRFLYRLALYRERVKGYPIKPYLTPQETMEDIRRNKERQLEAVKAAKAGKRRRFGGGVSEPVRESVREELDSALGPLLRLYYKVRYGDEMPRDEEVAELRQQLPR